MIPRFPGQVDVVKLNAEQINALVSVACSDVFDALSATDARSAREVAADVERSPASVSEQLAKLLQVGLIIPAGTRKRRSRTEALYVHAGRLTRFFLTDQSEDEVAQFKLRFKGQMRQAERQHDAFQDALKLDPTYADFCIYKYHSIYVDRERALRLKLAVTELQTLNHELSETSAEVRGEGEFVRVHVTLMSFPVQQESQRRSSGARKKVAD
jgi:hypothetical protein